MIRLTSLLFCCIGLTLLAGCEDDDAGAPTPAIDVPASYSFARDGASTVAFPGQSIRIAMAEELVAAMSDPEVTADALIDRFRNPEDAAPFTDADLNASTKAVRGKTAASAELFTTNTVASIAIKDRFEDWMRAQAAEVFPAWAELASPGQAGQIADGSSVRYVSADGLEYNQAVAKGLIGALLYDQMANNYLSPLVLDAGTNRADNTAGIVAEGQTYTSMEHKWDEAYGYLFGASDSPTTPLADLGDADNFLNKYLSRVDGDADYTGIAATVEAAFRRGRAAIVAGDYALRDEQAAVIIEELDRVLAVRAVYYLMQGKAALEATPVARGTAFHDLSEAYGFLYSLRFTAAPEEYTNYATTIDARLDEIMGGPDGLWSVAPTTLERIATDIAAEFGLDFADAAN